MKKKLWCVLYHDTCMMMIAACGQKRPGEEKTDRQKQNLRTGKI